MSQTVRIIVIIAQQKQLKGMAAFGGYRRSGRAYLKLSLPVTDWFALARHRSYCHAASSLLLDHPAWEKTSASCYQPTSAALLKITPQISSNFAQISNFYFSRFPTRILIRANEHKWRPIGSNENTPRVVVTIPDEPEENGQP